MPTISNMIVMDQFDYKMMAMRERWTLGDTIALLACFEHDTKGHHSKANAKYIYTKLWDKYYEYITNLMFSGFIKYTTYIDSTDIDLMRQEAQGSVTNTETSTFEQTAFIEYIENNNMLKIDIEMLKRCLAGDEIIPGPIPLVNENASQELSSEESIEIDSYNLPKLKKKVSELTNEKCKWDKSIVAALNIGLQIKEKELTSDITEKAFADEFEKELMGLPKTTITMIRKALPSGYQNKGGSPTKAPKGINDATVDIIIDASVLAGFLSHKEEIEVLDELEIRLTEDEYEIPTRNYLAAIRKACKKVIKKYV